MAAGASTTRYGSGPVTRLTRTPRGFRPPGTRRSRRRQCRHHARTRRAPPRRTPDLQRPRPFPARAGGPRRRRRARCDRTARPRPSPTDRAPDRDRTSLSWGQYSSLLAYLQGVRGTMSAAVGLARATVALTMRFLVARNPEPDSRLPYLVRL